MGQFCMRASPEASQGKRRGRNEYSPPLITSYRPLRSRLHHPPETVIVPVGSGFSQLCVQPHQQLQSLSRKPPFTRQNSPSRSEAEGDVKIATYGVRVRVGDLVIQRRPAFLIDGFDR